MKLEVSQKLSTDVLVIGGGLAGLRAAIEARKHGVDVTIISESPAGYANNSAISRAAMAATGISTKPGDSIESHINDTVESGRYVNDPRLIAVMARGARQQVYDLISFGVLFQRRDGELLVMRTAGHSFSRHVFAESFRGINITRPMRHYAASRGCHFIEGVLVTRLLTAQDTVVGVLGIDKQGQLLVTNAKSTILATGGGGEIYPTTTNALGTTGDGYVLAYDLGLSLRDMEFVQFQTAWGKNSKKILTYERFLPRGATLRNSLGEDILKKHGLLDINKVTRDILTQAIMQEIQAGHGVEGKVIMDFTTLPEEQAQKMLHTGLIDQHFYHKQVPVSPSAHFFMGGVRINENAETQVNGLYAAGEVCGGLHGANRLGGNAIPGALVFGAVAGSRAADRVSKTALVAAPVGQIAAERERLRGLASREGKANLDELRQSLRQVMWDKVGIIRSQEGLEEALANIMGIREQLKMASVRDYSQLTRAIKLTNMLTASEMVCRAALARKESRGAHCRTDYPEENDGNWLKVIEISRKAEGMTLGFVPVSTKP